MKYDISYANLMLYSASLPSYGNYKKNRDAEAGDDDIIKADDPNNRGNVLAIINGQKF